MIRSGSSIRYASHSVESSFTLVPDDVRATLAREDEVIPSIPVEILNVDLKADAGPLAGRGCGNEVFDPGAGVWFPVIILNRHIIVRSGIFSGVGVVALTCDEFVFAIVVDVFPGKAVGL